MATTTTSTVAPEIAPYLTYGLQQASNLYQGGGPQYYTGETFVAPYGVFVLSSGELKKNEPRKTNRTQKSFG